MNKHNNKLLCALLTTIIAFCLAGCGQDFTTGTPFEKTTGSPSADPGKDSQGTETSPSSTSRDGSKSDPDSEGSKSGTNNNSPDDAKPGTQNSGSDGNGTVNDPETQGNSTSDPGAENTVTPDAQPTITDPLPTPTPANTNAEPDRNEYWEKTFLVWLPMFPYGQLSKIDYAGTYDYATFTDISSQNIRDYVATLKGAGFTHISVENYSDSAISFIATNDKSWEVRVSFTETILVLGSGFNDTDSGDEDKAEKLFSTTMLQYMPKFTDGTYISSETRSDESMFASVVYTDVTEAEALSYIEKVKDKGYIYVEDEGNQDGTIWYMAINDERFECHVEFSGSEIKIGCGNLEDD